MLELLENFSFHQIAFYTIFLLFAIKEFVDFYTWGAEKNRDRLNAGYNRRRNEEILNERYSEYNSRCEAFNDQYQKLNEKLEKMEENLNLKVEGLESQISQLIDSDKNDIKSWIIEKHHIFTKQQWIDDFSMDSIELRFANYRDEGGNSYVETLVKELRKLPKYPPESNE